MYETMVSAYDMYSFYFKAVFMGIAIALGFIKIITQIFRMLKHHEVTSENVIGLVIGIIVEYIFFMNVYSRLVVCNGLQFLTEKDEDAVVKAGVIQTYMESERISNHGYPKDVVIDGELYLWMNKVYVPAGSIVEITYMPKSKVILEMDILKRADYWERINELEPHSVTWAQEDYAVYAWWDLFFMAIGFCCIMSLNIFRVRHMDLALLAVMSVGMGLVILPANDLGGKDWYVLFANEETCSAKGVVSKCTDSREVMHFGMMDITVDGNSYTFPAITGIKTGDYVEIEYLPKCRYVTSIYVEPRIYNDGDIRANQYYELHVKNMESGVYNLNYELMDAKKNIMYTKNICAKNIMFSMVNDDLVKVAVKYGEGEDSVCCSYFNVRTGALSDEFVGVVYQDDTYVAYFVDDELVVRDIFDGDSFYREVDMHGKKVNPENPCITLKKSETEGSLVVEYRDDSLEKCYQQTIDL